MFKAILGAEDNRHLLIHFLNALIGRDLPSLITSVDILPTSSEREFLDDKQTVVDIKAFLAEQYATEVSPEFISSVTDAVMGEVTAWQARLHGRQCRRCWSCP